MKVVILAGGKGVRLGEKYKKIPKPFVKINNYSIAENLINLFNSYGYKDFIICCDHRNNIAKKLVQKSILENNNLKFINTGRNSNTLLRIYKIKKYLDNNDFFLCYGDGLANLNINKLKKNHIQNKKHITMTCYPYTPDKGIIKITNKRHKFYEKVLMRNYWVNIGFFIITKKILNKIKNKNISFEETLLKNCILKDKVNFYKFKGKWQCLDTQKDIEKIKKLKAEKLL